MKTAAVNALGCLLAALPVIVEATPPHFAQLAQRCAPDVHPITLAGLVMTESSWNPFAIGVVGGRLDRQPASVAEAVAAARGLERQGVNFSMGYGQVNRANLAKYGASYQTVFEPCTNLRASSAILKECFVRAKRQDPDDQKALRAALSCYYSGDFRRGFNAARPGAPSYVQKVVANAIRYTQHAPLVPAILVPGEEAGGTVSDADPFPAQQDRTATRPQSSQTKTREWVIFADRAPAQGTSRQQDLVDSKLSTSESLLPSRKIGAPGDAERNRPDSAKRKQYVPIRIERTRETEKEAPFVKLVP